MHLDEQQIRDLIADWMAASKAGDTGRVLAMMTDDAVFLTPGNPPMTKSDFAENSRRMHSSGAVVDGNSEIREIQVFGDWAFVRSHVTVSVTSPQGKAMERQGDVLTLFSRRSGKWLLARDANLLAPVETS